MFRIQKLFTERGNILAVAWMFNQLAYAIVYPFIPIYLSNERQIPYTSVGLIFPLMGLMCIFTPMAVGPLTDRLGRRAMMDFGQFARAVMFLILAVMTFFNAPFWLFALMLMVNTGVGVAFQVGADAYLADVTTEAERPEYYSRIRIGINVGWALGPMIGAFFAKTPFWLFFTITAVLCIGGGIFSHRFCTYKPGESFVRTPVKKKQQNDSILPLLWKQKRLFHLLAGAFMLFCLASQLYSTLSVFSTQKVGISKEALGLIYSLNGAMIVFFQLPLTNLMKKLKVSLTRQLYAGALCYISGYIAVGFCTAAWQIAAAVTIITIGELIIQPALYSAISGETVKENAGRILAAYSLFRGVGYTVGPWVGAQCFGCIASGIFLWGALACFAMAALFFFRMAGKSRKKETKITG